uniref:Uncharacterized protein n=1 Tax=Arundo donax TaxID=35708 RepID=A0A0A9G6N0_ARUDO
MLKKQPHLLRCMSGKVRKLTKRPIPCSICASMSRVCKLSSWKTELGSATS